MRHMCSLIVGLGAGFLFVKMFTYTQKSPNVDDVLGVWPLHDICRAYGFVACGIFGLEIFGGLGGVSLLAQLYGTRFVIFVSIMGALIIYGTLKFTIDFRLDDEDEFVGGDISIYRVSASSDKVID